MERTIRKGWLYWGLLLVYTVGCDQPQKEFLVSSQNEYPIKIKRVIDGDTYVGDVELPFSVSLRDQHIRCLGYDAQELPTPKGIEAKNHLTTLLNSGSVFVSPGGREKDSFGRLLVTTRVYAGQTAIDISQHMKEQGFNEN